MNHQYNAISKCNRNHGKEWYGYLIPKEVLALKDLGVILDPRDLELAVYRKRNGINNGRWTYFTANKEFEEVRRGQRILGDQGDRY